MPIKFVKKVGNVTPIGRMEANKKNFSRSINTAVCLFGTAAKIVYCRGWFYVLKEHDYTEVLKHEL